MCNGPAQLPCCVCVNMFIGIWYTHTFYTIKITTNKIINYYLGVNIRQISNPVLAPGCLLV